MLFIAAPPLILNKSPITIAILGEVFNVRCIASGGPKPKVHWKHMNIDISPNSHLWVCSHKFKCYFPNKILHINLVHFYVFHRLLQTGDNGLLSIDEVEKDDAAQFKCVAVNSNGESDVWVTNITVMGQCSFSF